MSQYIIESVNDSVNAITPKFSFVRQSGIFTYGMFDKRVAFNGVKQSGYYGSVPSHWPLDGEVVHVHGLANGEQLTSDFLLIYMSLEVLQTHITFCRNYQRIVLFYTGIMWYSWNAKRFAPSSATINGGRSRRPVLQLWF